jgi:hexosaminidase
MTEQTGEFRISAGTKICYDPGNDELKKIADGLSAGLQSYTGQNIPIVPLVQPAEKNTIVLTLKNAPDSLGAEGYVLNITGNRAIVKALTPAGVFYGTETIYQLLPVQIGRPGSLSLPAVTIADKPRYEWRGMLLDVGRYYYSVEFIKKFIDYLALHKMNTFHWHLTEDQGWRIEIKKYPKLTELGAWRDQTLVGHLRDKPRVYDGKKHGGFYTQDQVREIVAYAKARYIEVVPEIEMPGHSGAALAAYPELSCTGGPFKVSDTWGVHEDVYCAGNEQTFTFLQDVLTEVTALFPCPVIHIGGDECPKTRWKQCPKCQARIKAEGLKDEHELQSYFIKRMEKFLLTKNKNIIGWDEILEGGLAPQATVMSWRGITGGIAAAKQHHNVVMTPGEYVYLDHYQGDPALEPLAIGGYTTLEKTYAYNPTPTELSPEDARFIKGAQGNVWTEYIATPEHVEYMMMPRMAALCEVLWSQPANKDWGDFKKRMQHQYRLYDKLGIHYSGSAFNVQQFARVDTSGKQALILLKTDSYRPEIYYTIDGTEPGLKSIKYEAPFLITRSAVIKAASFEGAGKKGKTTVQSVTLQH